MIYIDTLLNNQFLLLGFVFFFLSVFIFRIIHPYLFGIMIVVFGMCYYFYHQKIKETDTLVLDDNKWIIQLPFQKSYLLLKHNDLMVELKKLYRNYGHFSFYNEAVYNILRFIDDYNDFVDGRVENSSVYSLERFARGLVWYRDLALNALMSISLHIKPLHEQKTRCRTRNCFDSKLQGNYDKPVPQRKKEYVDTVQKISLYLTGFLSEVIYNSSLNADQITITPMNGWQENMLDHWANI